MDIYKESILLHEKLSGKIEISTKATITSKEDLSLLYSPGVAQPCLEIAKDISKVYDYTIKGNTIAVITDGSAVLGLGNIKAHASIPVMEGKAALFNVFAGVNAFPICLDTQDAEEIINICKMIAPVFGGINLEDIAAPKCFYIEKRLQEELDIPVFHDDQHGTAIVTLAGLINSLKLVNKDIRSTQVIINGIGSAGSAITKLLVEFDFKNFTLCDRNGELYSGTITKNNLDEVFTLVRKRIESGYSQNNLATSIVHKDVFIGVSSANVLTREMLESMNEKPIVFAMANPNPEVMPKIASEANVAVICTGRSDFPNQINNVLVFPGIFKGALSAKATVINDSMKKAAVYAIANIIDESELNKDYVIPSPFDERVVKAVSFAVHEAAILTGVVRK